MSAQVPVTLRTRCGCEQQITIDYMLARHSGWTVALREDPKPITEYIALENSDVRRTRHFRWRGRYDEARRMIPEEE